MQAIIDDKTFEGVGGHVQVMIAGSDGAQFPVALNDEGEGHLIGIDVTSEPVGALRVGGYDFGDIDAGGRLFFCELSC
ncbi:MAG: hypothetical protein ABJF50_17265 [Paracoccaceae bacterium]